MSRLIVPPKEVSATRVDVVDFTPDLVAGQSPTYANVTASVSVYSGSETSPALTVTATAGSYPYYTVNVTTSGGTSGVVYAVRVTMPTTAPTATLVKTYFLAVIPDLP
jgi:hypothetical protein